MYSSMDSNEDKVTLTKNQLQAILELISQMGGMKSSDTTKEVIPQTNYADRYVNNSSESSTIAVRSRDMKRDQSLYGSQGSLVAKKRMQWNQDREDAMKSDLWFQKFESDDSRSQIRSRDNSLSGRYSPFSAESSSMPTTPSNCSNNSLPYPPPPTPANSAYETRSYRRYNRAESDPLAVEEKRQKVIEYQRELQAQKEEKERRLRDEKLKQKQEEALIEKRFLEQQQRLQKEYEEEQRKIMEKQQNAEKKRLAVVAAIQRTPSLKKSSSNRSVNLNRETVNVQNDVEERNASATSSKDSAIQTDGHYNFQANGKNIGTQTDYHLIYRWFNEITPPKSGLRYKKRISSEFNNNNIRTADSHSRTPSPKSIPKSTNDDIRSAIKSRYTVREPRNSANKSASKKTGNRLKTAESNHTLRLQTVKHLNCTQSLGNNEEQSTGDYHLSLSSSSSQEFEVKGNSLNHFRSNSPPIPTIQRRLSEACTANEKKNICLPSIVDKEVRPHSRRKWRSQETFNPHVINTIEVNSK